MVLRKLAGTGMSCWGAGTISVKVRFARWVGVRVDMAALRVIGTTRRLEFN